MHTLNDEEMIDRSLGALLAQRFPVEEVVIVDNGSTDSTLKKISSAAVTVVRHSENRGTSGAVATGFEYALAKGYDWIWVLDADSLPHRDALEMLVRLHASFDRKARPPVGVLSSTNRLMPFSQPNYGRLLTPGGPRLPKIEARLPYCECDATIWTGSLFNLAAVRAVGYPRWGKAGYWDDLSLDYGDIEFSYRIKRAGYAVLVHRSSIIDHVVGRPKSAQVFGRRFVSSNHSAVRRHLYFRNLVYFWLYLYPRKRWFMLTVWFSYRWLVTVLGILLLERENIGAKVWACVRGPWDGARKQLQERIAKDGERLEATRSLVRRSTGESRS